MKKRLVLYILSCIVIGLLSFQMTHAFLVGRDDRVNVLTVGETVIEIIEDDYRPPAELVPGVSFVKAPYMKNTGNLACFVRMRADFSHSDARDFCRPLTVNTADWEYSAADGYYYYNKVLQPGEATSPLFTKVEVRPDVEKSKLIPFDILIYGEALQQGGRAGGAYLTVWSEEG